MSTTSPMARPWRNEPEAVALCSWGEGEHAAIGEALALPLRDWTEDWELPATNPAQVRCTAAVDSAAAADSTWTDVGGAEGAGAWLQWEDGQAVSMARAWFGGDAGLSPVVAAMVEACRQDLLRRIEGALRLGSAASHRTLDASSWNRWSGAVVARLPACGLLLVQAGAVRAIARSKGKNPSGVGAQPLITVRDALRPTLVQLEVELDGCDLDLGELQALQIGDVLALRHRVDAPALLAQPGGDVLLSGWLARVRGRKAVELATPATSARC